MSELNLQKAMAERRAGIKQVSGHNQTFLESARGIARMLCREKGRITNDDVRMECEKRGLKPAHHNGWSVILRATEFEPVAFVRSKLVQGHGNIVREYRLRGGA